MKNISREEIEESLFALFKSAGRKPDTIPPGWFTIEQISTSAKRSRAYINIRLNKLVKLGIIPAPKRFYAITPKGVRQVQHYYIPRPQKMKTSQLP